MKGKEEDKNKDELETIKARLQESIQENGKFSINIEAVQKSLAEANKKVETQQAELNKELLSVRKERDSLKQELEDLRNGAMRLKRDLEKKSKELIEVSGQLEVQGQEKAEIHLKQRNVEIELKQTIEYVLFKTKCHQEFRQVVATLSKKLQPFQQILNKMCTEMREKVGALGKLIEPTDSEKVSVFKIQSRTILACIEKIEKDGQGVDMSQILDSFQSLNAEIIKPLLFKAEEVITSIDELYSQAAQQMVEIGYEGTTSSHHTGRDKTRVSFCPQ